ncbi:hypothetical protein PPO43_14005 [Saprospira sp. CCB-QB6]|nr:hypothetical protein [Saprospira sp. CCB-QB6]WCL81084.1 hypothetical protein PPO43_14005 [Saprospira sp. CCB-QB6]
MPHLISFNAALPAKGLVFTDYYLQEERTGFNAASPAMGLV